MWIWDSERLEIKTILLSILVAFFFFPGFSGG